MVPMRWTRKGLFSSSLKSQGVEEVGDLPRSIFPPNYNMELHEPQFKREVVLW